MTVRRELGGRLWARWRYEDRVGSDASPDDMRLPGDPFRAVAEGCASVVVTCHLEHAWVSRHAFHAQPWPERAVRGCQVWHESIQDDFGEDRKPQLRTCIAVGRAGHGEVRAAVASGRAE